MELGILSPELPGALETAQVAYPDQQQNQAAQRWSMALVTMQRLPALGEIILPVIVGATVIFELVGPVLTRVALHRVGEAPKVAGSANTDH